MENRNSGKEISAILFVVIIGLAFFSMAAWWPPEFFKKLIAPPLETGAAAPQFQLESFAGGDVSLKDFSGKPVLLKFWSNG